MWILSDQNRPKLDMIHLKTMQDVAADIGALIRALILILVCLHQHHPAAALPHTGGRCTGPAAGCCSHPLQTECLVVLFATSLLPFPGWQPHCVHACVSKAKQSKTGLDCKQHKHKHPPTCVCFSVHELLRQPRRDDSCVAGELDGDGNDFYCY